MEVSPRARGEGVSGYERLVAHGVVLATALPQGATHAKCQSRGEGAIQDIHPLFWIHHWMQLNPTVISLIDLTCLSSQACVPVLFSLSLVA